MTYSSSYYGSDKAEYKKPITVELDDYVSLKIKETTAYLNKQYDNLQNKYEDKRNAIREEAKRECEEELKKLKEKIERLQDEIWYKDSAIKKYEEVLKALSSRRFIGRTVRKIYKKYNDLWWSVESTIKTK